MDLNNLKPKKGSKHVRKRVGRGPGSGNGKTAGRGEKGQKSRSGYTGKLGFEGGQMPLIRRLPKRGFNNAAFHKHYAIVNLSDLNDFKAGTVVNEQLLRESQLVRGNVFGVKILGNGELKHALKIEADKISASAREKIDKAGGTITLREARPRPGRRAEEDAEGSQAEAPVGAGTERAAKKPVAKKSASKSGARPKTATRKR